MAWKCKIKVRETVQHEEEFATEEEARARVESVKAEGTLIGLTKDWTECSDCEWAQGNVHLEIAEA